MPKTETLTRWRPTFADADAARRYVEAACEKDPGDGSLMLAALREVVKSQTFSGAAREMGLSRHGLRKALSDGGNPRLSTLLALARGLNMRLSLVIPEPHRRLGDLEEDCTETGPPCVHFPDDPARE